MHRTIDGANKQGKGEQKTEAHGDLHYLDVCQHESISTCLSDATGLEPEADDGQTRNNPSGTKAGFKNRRMGIIGKSGFRRLEFVK